jgi:hypothetical protein
MRASRLKPRARSAGLLVRDLPGELLVYDKDRHQAHCLNRTAALVFRHADGQCTVLELADRLRAETGWPADESLVRSALEQLAGAGLLQADGDLPADVDPAAPFARSSVSRREVLRHVGLGAVVLAPVVTSLLVPTPAEAAATCIPVTSCQSGVNDGQPCYISNPATECTLRTCQGTGVCSP